MAVKTILVLCAQALVLQSALSQCIGRGAAIGPGIAPFGVPYEGLAYGPGCGLGGIGPASSGGGFAVTSASPIAPTGITVVSENAIEGALTVGGQLPFLGAVALEGAFATTGAGAISYSCGNGAVGIINEGLGAGPIVGAGPYGPGLAAGPAFGPGLAAGPVYGPGLAPGLGFNGLGGCGSYY